MSKDKDLKIGDRIREKKTGREMDVVELPEVYDVDDRKSVRNDKVVYSIFEDGKVNNTIGEINVADIERIDQDNEA